MNDLFMMRFTMCLMFVCRASPYPECEHGKQCVLTKAAPDVSHRVSDENATCQIPACKLYQCSYIAVACSIGHDREQGQ